MRKRQRLFWHEFSIIRLSVARMRLNFLSVGVDSEPPHISPARGPPLWQDGGDAQMDDGAQIEPAGWDLAAPPAPDFEVDQRISW